MQNYKITLLIVRFATENPYLYGKKGETMDRVFHARVGAARYLPITRFKRCIWIPNPSSSSLSSPS